MARVSLVKRLQIGRERTRTIDWPFPVEGDAPRVRVRVLSHADREAAHFATVEYFQAKKLKAAPREEVFTARQELEYIFRAFTDLEGDPIAASVDELAAEPYQLRSALILEWLSLQMDATQRYTKAEVETLVEDLKKNGREVPLNGCASSLLIELVRTLAEQLSTSTTTSSSG